MYKESLKFSLKCPKHKGFTPSNGAQSIKGGCFMCHRIVCLYRELRSIEEDVRKLKEDLEKEN